MQRNPGDEFSNGMDHRAVSPPQVDQNSGDGSINGGGGGGVGVGGGGSRHVPLNIVPSASSSADENIGVREVNWLLEACGIDRNQPIVDLKQCSSSLFVLLFRRLFDVDLPNLELEPDTFDKKLHNIRCVLRELEAILQQPLGHVSAEEIVLLNKDHIREMIRVFVYIVRAMQQVDDDGNANGAANGGGLGGNGGGSAHMAEGEAPSSVDSAQKTQELVRDWKQGVLPPPPRRPGQRVDPTTIAALKEHIRRVDEYTGKRERPQRHLSRTRVTVVPPVQQRLSAVNAARDAKIERLRSQRFIEGLQREVRAAMAAEATRVELGVRRALQRRVEAQHRDLIEAKRAAFEQDKRYRDAYACVVESARNQFQTHAQLIGEETTRIAQNSAAASREARRTAHEYGRQHRRKMETQYRQYVDALCSWRNGAFFE